MKKITTFFLLLFSALVIGQTTYNIDSPEAVRDVFYQPGDVIILKNGTYTTDERIRFLGSGTAENPVILRAETPGGVIFTGGPRLTIGGESDDTGAQIATGEYLIVDGFHWKGGYGASNFIEFRNGTNYAHHSTIRNCAIDGLGIEPTELSEDLADEQIPKHRWIVLYGTYNSVINCTFMNKESAGAIILGEYSYNAFPVVPEGDPEINNSCAEVGHTIMNNYFYNYQKITELYPYTKANGDPYSNSGDCETIRIGTSSYQMVNSNVTVSNNYFVQADGENEIITNKSKGNTYTNNTFRRCRGSLVLRHGSNATVDGNYFLGEDVEGTGGIRISDSYHTITNNYIQDCVTKNNFAKWNNGITFIGGGANADVSCTTDNTSNGYQETNGITVSNNTIVNTNAPLFYNVNTDNNNDITGTVSNNLIYFENGNSNTTPVISGDDPTSYASIGATLTYSGNVYTGTTLGETNTGFSEETGITANADGEIFTFSGTGSAGKGADMGAYTPATDAMVGYGIGACFLDYTGTGITDGDCTIEVIETLTVSSLAPLPPAAGSYDVSVNANVSWTAQANDAWISIDVTSGSGAATVSVTVTENTETTERVGSVTFTQDPGGDDIVRTLTVTQEGADLTDIYDLINDEVGGGPVSIHSFSKQQVDGSSKFNYAANTLDKDTGTQWTADDDAILAGDYKGDGEYVIFDLDEEYDLDLIRIATDDKSDPYGVQVWISTTGTDPGDFTKLLLSTGDLVITTTTGTRTDYDQFEITANARYVKLVGFGRFNTAGDTRKSQWTNITEVEFYGTASSLSTNDIAVDQVKLYPNPVKDGTLYLSKQINDLDKLTIYSISGKAIFSKDLNTSLNKETIDLSTISEGLYFVEIKKGNSKSLSKIIISN